MPMKRPLDGGKMKTVIKFDESGGEPPASSSLFGKRIVESERPHTAKLAAFSTE